MVINLNLGGLKRALRGLLYVKKVKVVDGKKTTVYKFSWRKTLKLWLAAQTLLFALFMLEEAFQQTTFGNFPLGDVHRYDIMAKNVKAQRVIMTMGKYVNYVVGWTNPVFFIAYYATFNLAEPAYVRSMEAVIADHKGDNTPPVISETVPVQTQSKVASKDLFLPPPKVQGAILYTEAKKWYGFRKTVIVAVTRVDTREKVAIAHTQGSFEIVAFPRQKAAYDSIKDLEGKWVVVTGAIGMYHSMYQIILDSPSQIIKTSPLLK